MVDFIFTVVITIISHKIWILGLYTGIYGT